MIEGIYILRTRRKDSGLEYRLYSGSKIHTIYKALDESGRWIPDKETILKYFESSPVYDDYGDVIKIAIKKAEKVNKTLLDGVTEITQFTTYSFDEIKNSIHKEA